MVAITQNTLEFIYPTQLQFDYEYFTADIEKSVGEEIFKYVFGVEGFVRPTASFDILNQIDFSKYLKPGLYKTGNKKFDELKVKGLDEIEWKHTMFLEYHGTNHLDKVVIMPLEITGRFYAGLKQGAGSRAGPSQ